MTEQQSLLSPGLSSMAVPIDSLVPHPRNSRRGDIGAIKASLMANRQYAPLVVQSGTNFICKGNHTYKAAVELGWRTIAAVAIDCDDEEALQILEIDNLTSDLGQYDEKQRRRNFEDVAAYLQEVRAGRRKPKLAVGDQANFDLLIADERERLAGVAQVVEALPTDAAYGETDDAFARRVEAATEAGDGAPGSSVEAATLARAMGFREVILMFKVEEYGQVLLICDRIKKVHPEVSSNSSAVLLALSEWFAQKYPDEVAASPGSFQAQVESHRASDWPGLAEE